MTLPRAFTFSILAALLLGCPPPPIGHLCNHTPALIEYCSGWWSCKEILPGQVAEIRLTYSQPFRFSIRLPTREVDYEISRRVQIDYARRDPESNCPNCPRYYFQLEPDMRVFILTPDLTPPAASLPPQHSDHPPNSPRLPLPLGAGGGVFLPPPRFSPPRRFPPAAAQRLPASA